MTPDEEHSAINQTSDSLVTRENTDPSDSDQSILPEAVYKEQGEVSREKCSPNPENNQTEIIIPNDEGTSRLFLFHKK